MTNIIAFKGAPGTDYDGLTSMVSLPHGGKYYLITFFDMGERLEDLTKHIKSHDRAVAIAKSFVTGIEA